jgi:hypothetical protein
MHTVFTQKHHASFPDHYLKNGGSPYNYAQIKTCSIKVYVWEDCEGVTLYLSNCGKRPRISWQGYSSCRQPLQTYIIKWATQCRNLFMETACFCVNYCGNLNTHSPVTPENCAYGYMTSWTGNGLRSKLLKSWNTLYMWVWKCYCRTNCSSHNLMLTESKSTDSAMLPYWHW